MRFYAHHGCFEQERAIGTHFRVDLTFMTDTARAELTDEMMKPSNLLEHVARRVGEAVLAQFAAVEDVKVKVYKLNPPLGGQMDSVSVEVALDRRAR